MAFNIKKDVEPPKDDDIVPFGQYKGAHWEDMKVEYLHWCYHNTYREDVKAYCIHNLLALMKENEDLIWSK
jgi:uncharacterized protein (DUF3820 family)